MKKITIGLFFLVLSGIASAQITNDAVGSIEFVAEELKSLINKNAKIEVLAEGFQFTEGPLWFEKEKMLLFSDVPANTIYKWTESTGKQVYLKPGGYTGTVSRGGFLGSNGLLLSAAGQLLICQHGDRRIARMDAPINSPMAKFVSVAEKYDGKRLNSPNDLFLAKNGDLYFTDPSYGIDPSGQSKKELTFQGVYKMNRSGTLTLLIDSLKQPNGIGIFPDGKKLLVSDSDDGKNKWYQYDVSADGSVSNGRVFYDPGAGNGPGGCDGFKIDKAGNLFATGPGGVWIFTETGKLIGKIKVNGVVAANCTLTPDGKTMFITASNLLLRVKMR